MRKKTIAVCGLALMFAVSTIGCGSPASSNSTTDSKSKSTETASEATDGTTVAASSTESEQKDIDAISDELQDWEKEYAEEFEMTGDEAQNWGYICQDFTGEFVYRVLNAFQEYTEEAFPNVNLSVSDGKGEVNTHIEIAENYITQGVDVLIDNATDADGEVVICEMAEEAGIPFVVVNSRISCDPMDHPYVGSEDYLAGHLQGEYIATLDDTEPLQICYICGSDGYVQTYERRDGLFDALEELGVNYELLSEQDGEYIRDKGMDITEDWITSYGDKIDVIASANDEMSMGALEALKAAGQENTICCGIDANSDALNAVKEGRFGCTVFQDAANQGKWGAIVAYAAAKGYTYDQGNEGVTIPFVLITEDNVDEYL